MVCIPRRGATKSGLGVGAEVAALGCPAQPGDEAPVGLGRRQQLRGGGGRAELPGRAGMDAAEKWFDQPLGHLWAEARGDEVVHAYVIPTAPGNSARQHQVERRSADAADRKDPGP